MGEGAILWLVSMEPQVEHKSAEHMSLHASNRSLTTNAAPCDIRASRSISPTRIPPPTCKSVKFVKEGRGGACLAALDRLFGEFVDGASGANLIPEAVNVLP